MAHVSTEYSPKLWYLKSDPSALSLYERHPKYFWQPETSIHITIIGRNKSNFMNTMSQRVVPKRMQEIINLLWQWWEEVSSTGVVLFPTLSSITILWFIIMVTFRNDCRSIILSPEQKEMLLLFMMSGKDGIGSVTSGDDFMMNHSLLLHHIEKQVYGSLFVTNTHCNMYPGVNDARATCCVRVSKRISRRVTSSVMEIISQRSLVIFGLIIGVVLLTVAIIGGYILSKRKSRSLRRAAGKDQRTPPDSSTTQNHDSGKKPLSEPPSHPSPSIKTNADSSSDNESVGSSLSIERFSTQSVGTLFRKISSRRSRSSSSSGSNTPSPSKSVSEDSLSLNHQSGVGVATVTSDINSPESGAKCKASPEMTVGSDLDLGGATHGSNESLGFDSGQYKQYKKRSSEINYKWSFTNYWLFIN